MFAAVYMASILQNMSVYLFDNAGNKTISQLDANVMDLISTSFLMRV